MDLLSAAIDGNVHGIGIGNKEVGGRASRQKSVRVYVLRKLPKRQLTKAARLPESIEGVPIDIVEMGVPSIQADLTRRQRPLEMGYSVSHEDVLNGSLGAVVKWKGRAGTFVLSCSHVLAPPGVRDTGDGVLQPAVTDNGRRTADRIGTLKKWKAPEGGNRLNRVDAAIAKLKTSVSARNRFGVAAVSVSASNFLTEAEQAAAGGVGAVFKRGRTTKITHGRVDDYSWDGRVEIRTAGGGEQLVKFRDQILVKSSRASAPFSEPGDSGALVIEKSTSKCIGLLVAGERRRTMISPMWRVLDVPGVWSLEVVSTPG